MTFSHHHAHAPARRDVDMTQGSITRHLIQFALPLLAGNVFQQLYNMVDTWVVGNFVSNEAFSAVGTVGPIINMLIGFFMGLSSGAGVVISQYYGAHRPEKVQDTVHTAMVLTLVLCKVIFFSGSAMAAPSGEGLTFGAVAMPLSWLPLISDYTRQAQKPVRATVASVVTYGLVSCWMYVIGMGAAIFTGEYDIAVIMVKAGLGIAALVILVFSTVTTTFLDAWSAGISAESLSGKLSGKTVAIVTTLVGVAGAILFPMDDITNFLYLIGSVFAPMIAVQIADHFLLRRDRFAVAADARNLVIWLIGFVAYRLLMGVDTPVGYTLPDMVLTILLCVIAEKLKPSVKQS